MTNTSDLQTVQLLTVLCCDWSDFASQLSAHGHQDKFVKELDAGLNEIQSSGGRLVSRDANSVMAAWGLFESREDDAERAVHFALKLRDAVRPFVIEGILPLKQVLATGEVTVVKEAEKAACSGPVVELCRRLLSVLPDGGVAVSQDTFRLIEGVFSARPLAQIPVIGRTEPVEVYRVLSERAIQFRIVQHGVEGITTRLIGREIEMKRLRDAYEIATDERENHLITLVGEAGTGKTRLLLEVERWRDLMNESTRLFRAQASPEMMEQPYSVLRRIFMLRFGIQDSDPETLAFEKMLKGVEGFMGSGHDGDALLLAQLVGLPSPASLQPGDASSAALFEQRALRSLSNFFRAVDAATLRGVVAFNLEDMQWADEKSLDALLWLLRNNVHNRIVAVVLARPELLERYPRWGLGQTNSIRIDLHALTTRDARKLVREILQKVPEVPDVLRDWIVERSGGNPLYIEELIRTLIATGVILTETGSQPWRLDMKRLNSVRIPDTLRGLLQIQLSNLAPVQRSILQRGAVVGRSFWDAALSALDSGENTLLPLNAAVAALVRRNLIYRQERSSFAGMQEYAFVSNLMYEEAYHSMPETLRRHYHKLSAEWLMKVSAETPSQAARIADHFERAGEGKRAVAYLALAAEEARRLNAFGQVRQFLQRAVGHADEISTSPDVPGKAILLYRLGETMIWLGEAAQALDYLQESLALARQAGDSWTMAEVLGRLGWAAYYVGNLPQAMTWLEEGLTCARESHNRPAQFLTLRQMGNAVSASGDYARAKEYYKESLKIAQELGDLAGTALALNNLGLAEILTGNYSDAHRSLGEAMQIAEQRGDRMGVALTLGNMGIADHLTGEYKLARQNLTQAIQESRALGSELVTAESLIWLGVSDAALGEFDQARHHLQEGLEAALTTNQFPLCLGVLVGFAYLAAQQKAPDQAVELLALTVENSSLDDLIRALLARPLLERLHSELPPQVFGLAWAHGILLNQDDVIQKFRS